MQLELDISYIGPNNGNKIYIFKGIINESLHQCIKCSDIMIYPKSEINEIPHESQFLYLYQILSSPKWMKWGNKTFIVALSFTVSPMTHYKSLHHHFFTLIEDTGGLFLLLNPLYMYLYRLRRRPLGAWYNFPRASLQRLRLKIWWTPRRL